MQFYLSNQNNPVDQNHVLWNRPLPVSRQGNPQPDDGSQHPGLTYGEYFTAVHTFLLTCPDCCDHANGPGPAKVSAFLEKHGAFYHPSRIAVGQGGHVEEYVLNVAFSEPGRKFLKTDFKTLKKLNNKYAYAFLPKVFACRELAVDDSRVVSMFMGEWFGSYHEFHVYGIQQGDPGKFRVWDPDHEECFLSKEQAREVYAQIAMILTACYDIETFEQVSAWHHAAGDFVVTLGVPEAPRVKLVTVRRYAPLVAVEEHDAEALVNGLLLFLLNLSIRMRLDRLDGVNDVCWMDDCIVPATLDGFFRGMDLQCRNNRIPRELAAFFKSYLAGMAEGEMHDLFASLAHRHPPDSPDAPVITAHIETHADSFFQAVKAAT